MDAESFTDLALRVIAGETTNDERRGLEAELASPARREEFERLKSTGDLLRATAPMTEAAKATAPALPAHRLNELRTAVRQHFGPAAQRGKAKVVSGGFVGALRWVFAGGGAAAVAAAMILMVFSNRTIEVGLYAVDLARNGDKPLSAADVPAARLVTFDYDAAFDQWQSQPLAWYEHAKIWVDNEHDQIHIVHREHLGRIVMETRQLAASDQAQREQIKQIVESLQK